MTDPRLFRVVMRRILADVVDGEFAPEEVLPNEMGVAARYGISRGVARESIRALEERGVVAVTHGRGQAIQTQERWSVADPDVLVTLGRLGAHKSLLPEAVAARAVHEKAAARRAASSTAAAESLRTAYDELMRQRGFRASPRAPDDLPVQADIAFHRELIAWGGNRVASAMVHPLNVALAILRHELLPERDAAARRHAERLVKSIEAGDPDGAEAAVSTQAKQLSGWFSGIASGGR